MATTTPAKRPTVTQKLALALEAHSTAENENERISEALNNAVMMLRQEDAGWALPGEDGYRGLDLDGIKKWAGQINTSLTGTESNAPNPHMRNGLMLRHSFIWSGNIHYAKIPGDPETPGKRGRANVQDLIDALDNQRLFFSSSARRRRENALYSEGLYLTIGKNSDKKLRPVPLHEITDTHRDELYEDDIVAYRWTRNEAGREPGTANNPGKLTGQRVKKSYWVFVDWFDGKIPDKILYESKEEEVLKDHTVFDLHANRPNGAAFGSPDAIAAIVWARIIRDLIMNGVKMQDALAMFAFKATSKTKAGQKQEALELAKDKQSGSAVAVGGENDLVPLSSAGRGYDFTSIGFVVSTMAASLHVSGIALSANTALAGSSYGAAKTLDLPGRMAMQTRRDEHIEYDKRVLRWMGAPDADVYFDNYDDATDEMRAVQAAMLAWSTGTLTAEGFRAELEAIYGRTFVGEIPEGVIIPNNQKQIDDAEAAATKVQAATPSQGKDSDAGGSDHMNDIKKKPK